MQIHFETTDTQAEKISDFLSESGAHAVIISSATTERVFTSGAEHPLWKSIIMTAIFEDEQSLDYAISELKNQFHITATVDNKTSSETTLIQPAFHPMSFGKRLWIYPSWEMNTKEHPCSITIEPGLAFGTGTHPTTAMCLEWLDQEVKNGMTVIDFGCGTGILALAAAKLGATHVLAIDNDPQAIQATTENAKRNRLTDQMTICTPNQAPTIRANLVIANILANPLIELSSQLSDLVEKNGKLAISGLLDHQAEAVIKAYSNRILLTKTQQLEDWVLLSGSRS